MSLWSLVPWPLQPGQREKSFQPEQDSGKMFKGHRCGDQMGSREGPCFLAPVVRFFCNSISWACVSRNQVTCLSVSTDGSVLLSGSHDETVRLWDIQSKQCIRTVTFKGRAGAVGKHRNGGRGLRGHEAMWLCPQVSHWARLWEAGPMRGKCLGHSWIGGQV